MGGLREIATQWQPMHPHTDVVNGDEGAGGEVIWHRPHDRSDDLRDTVRVHKGDAEVHVRGLHRAGGGQDR